MAFADSYNFHLTPRHKTTSFSKRKDTNITLPEHVLGHTVAPDTCQDASQIFPFLWLGSKIHAYDQDLMMGYKEIPNKISLIINISQKIENKFETEGISYMQIPFCDVIDSPMIDYFDETFRCIEQARLRNEIVFVHCRMGISRSATIVIAYIMRFLKTPFLEALKIVVEKRPIVEPNIGFIRQLEQYEKILKKEAK